MREIKFRVYDKANKRMVYFDFEDVFREGCECHLEAITDSKHLGLYPQWSLRDMPKMQFTGLTDKNGKEIYEGDILSFVFHDHFEEPEINLGYIKYDVCSYGLVFVEPDCMSLLNDFDIKKAEIIGNAHEDPVTIGE